MKYVEKKPFLFGSLEDPLLRFGGPWGILFLCLIKTDVECPKCFPQIQPFPGREASSCPSSPGSDMWKEMIPPDQQSGFPASQREPWEGSSSSASVRSKAGSHSPLSPLSNSLFCFLVLSTCFLSTTSPWRFVEGNSAVLPSPFAAWRACLLSFKEFKGWLPRSILHASICFSI